MTDERFIVVGWPGSLSVNRESSPCMDFIGLCAPHHVAARFRLMVLTAAR
jgi:hypothetical protein